MAKYERAHLFVMNTLRDQAEIKNTILLSHHKSYHIHSEYCRILCDDMKSILDYLEIEYDKSEMRASDLIQKHNA